MRFRQLLWRVPGLHWAVRAARSVILYARGLQRRRLIRDHLAQSTRKLNLGAGKHPFPGWLNTDVYPERGVKDVIYLDARRRFPLPSESFDFVYSEHMIEHISYRDGQRCLAECLRVLRPGGRIRIATPSLERFASLYNGAPSELAERFVRFVTETYVEDADAPLRGFVVNNLFWNWSHRFIYDAETLGHALAQAGFVDVRPFEVGASDTPEFVGVEARAEGADTPAEFNAFETLVLEATRP